jgi:hypothetical protein
MSSAFRLVEAATIAEQLARVLYSLPSILVTSAIQTRTALSGTV